MSDSIQKVFAFIGVIASLFGIYQFLAEFVFEKKAIEAAYKTAVLAEGNDFFETKDFLKPDLSFKRLIGVDVLVWNAGRETISESDVRSNFSIQIEKPSKIINVSGEVQKSKSIIIDGWDDNSYKFSWKAFDPKNYLKVHLLIGTDREKKDLANLIYIDGSIVRDIQARMKPFDKRRDKVDVWAWIFGVIIFFVGMFGSGLIPDEKIISTVIKNEWVFTKSILKSIMGLVETVAVVVLALVFGPALSVYLFGVPTWLDPVIFPPYYWERLFTSGGGG